MSGKLLRTHKLPENTTDYKDYEIFSNMDGRVLLKSKVALKNKKEEDFFEPW